MQVRKHALSWLVLLLPAILFAQSDNLAPCATQDGKVDWLIDYQKNPEHYTNYRTNNDTLYVPLTIHIVGESDSTGYFPMRDVRQQVCVLNSDFEESAIQFYIKNINYIANSTYNNHDWQAGGQMMDEYLVPSTINCYIVDSPAGACGYSAYNMGVALAESCIQPGDHTWAHEIGHYLSLPHTFLGWEGIDYDDDEPTPAQVNNWPVERVDGLNCEIAADGFCDTPPDYLSFRWFCPADGFSNQLQFDPDSMTFNSDGTYFMSYAFDNCMNRFSPDQISAMRANVLDEKPDHLGQDDVLGPIDITAFTPLAPAQGELIDNFNEVTFAWEPVDNVETYFLEASIFANFGLIIFKETTTETSVTTDAIPPNFDIYWRVTAWSDWETCEHESAPYSFSTGSLTSVQTPTALTGLTVYPNPVPAGSSLFIEGASDRTQDLVIELVDVSGRLLVQENTLFTEGTNQYELEAPNLPPGIYLVRVRSERGASTRKVVIQR